MGGGYHNDANDVYATVSGGRDNTASSGYATVGGGRDNTASGDYATVGGGYVNEAGDWGSTVGGGHDNAASGFTASVSGGRYNTASGTGATVAGGQYNEASGGYAIVGGGNENDAGGAYATVGGGHDNAASDYSATVGGGRDNTAIGNSATVGGGDLNTASGDYATVPGGQGNAAGGYYSFAGGYGAKVRNADEVGGGDMDGDEGSFVWSDSSVEDYFQSTGPNQFLIRAAGGVGIGTNNPAQALDVNGQIFSDHIALKTQGYLGYNMYWDTVDSRWEYREAGHASALRRDTDGRLQYYIADENAGAPADPVTGMIEKFTILHNGNVGIGTVTPDYELDVAGDINFTGDLYQNGSLFGGGGNCLWEQSDPNIYYNFGNVGIGTDTPAAQLTVAGGILRAGSTMYGAHADTHINLGTSSTTGKDGFDIGYATVGGGYLNDANDVYTTVSGGRDNTASGTCATVGGGSFNTASGLIATAGGGYNNDAYGNYSTVGGGRSNDASGDDAMVGGGRDNIASGEDATVAGGRENAASHRWATVAGGSRNIASGEGAMVGGGYRNDATNHYATVGGGGHNTSSGHAATVAGGSSNTAIAYCSTVGGGIQNFAYGVYATVPGGYQNTAGGDYSFAGGYRARVRTENEVGVGDYDGDEGTFVWADYSTLDYFESTGPNRFLIRANGGVGIGTNDPVFQLEVNGTAGKPGGGTWNISSDERLKKNIKKINGVEALDKITQLEGVIFEWINPQEHSEGVRAGVTAQQLEIVFPDWVEEVEAKGKDKALIPAGERAKAISFPHDFNAYLIEAIKEQQKQIETLQAEVKVLKAQLTTGK